MRRTVTPRGFALIEFDDRYGAACNIQESSLAEEAAIWLGVKSADPQIMASQAAAAGVVTDQKVGWVPYPVPAEVSLNTRMHLTQRHAAALIPVLQHFVKTGLLPDVVAAIKPKRVRRIRMCSCPHCKTPTPLAPKSRGEDLYMTICRHCYVAFENREVVDSWLEDPL